MENENADSRLIPQNANTMRNIGQNGLHVALWEPNRMEIIFKQLREAWYRVDAVNALRYADMLQWLYCDDTVTLSRKREIWEFCEMVKQRFNYID